METPTCRERLSSYCKGIGLDIGFGGEPIVPWAMCLDRELGNPLRAKHPCPGPTHLVGDANCLHWFRDNVLDFVFSSHCLEDFMDTVGVLREWCRVIKPGGFLVLFLPDEQVYRKIVGGIGNGQHKHDNFSLIYVKSCLARIPGMKIVHEMFPVPNNSYSFDLVAQKQ